MKKLLAIVLTLTLVLCCVPFGFTANAASSGITGDCTWALNGTVLTISGSGETGNYYWDETPWGYDITEVIVEDGVTYLGDRIFADCTKLSKVTLGKDLKTIRMNAFEYCESLESIEIPDGIVDIGTEAFYCTGIYNNEDNWEDGALYIGKHLICTQADNLPNEYSVKEGTLTIAHSAFEDCSDLTYIYIPESVVNIGADTFYNCKNLTEINIPSSVEYIGSNAFYNCKSIENVYIADLGAWCNTELINYESIPFNYNPNVYINGVLVEGELVIPDDIYSISAYTFYGLDSITSVVLGDSVEFIGQEAFADCEKLVSISMPEGMEIIEYRAFYACDLLESINIPNSVTYVGQMAFDGTAYFENESNWENGVFYTGRHLYKAKYNEVIGEYTVKDGTLTIVERAFSGNQEITSVIIPEGVTTIDYDAFCYCPKLTSVTLPKSVTLIGEYAFDDCDALIDVYYGGTVEDRENIFICENNSPLMSASWHYDDKTVTEIVPGDVNGDSVMNVSDLAQLKKLLAGLLSEVEIENLNADIDGNGTVNAGDLALLKKAIAGLASLDTPDNDDGNDDEPTQPETSELPLDEVPLNIDYKVADDFKIGVICLHDELSTYDANFINGINKVKTALNLNDDQVVLKTNIPESHECYTAAKELAEMGCDIVFADSYGHENFMLKAAKEFPDVEFCHATGVMAHTIGLDNFHNAFAKIHEGRYLTGVAAGMKLNELIKNGTINADNARIGFVGAFNFAECISAQTAFYLGAKSVCPTAIMDVQYIYSWYDVEREKEAAEYLIRNGCAVISQYSDSIGAPMACEAAGVANFGYNVDYTKECPNTFVLSTNIDWSHYFNYIIGCVVKGEEIAVDWAGGIDEGAVVLSAINSKVAAKATLEAVREKATALTKGVINVFDTKNITVNGNKINSYIADVDFDINFVPETEVVENGVIYESTKRSAPYFDLKIDGITIKN